MNLRDKCVEDGITLAEGKEKYGLTHWNQTVVETESKEEVAPVKDEAPAIETESQQDLTDPKQFSIFILGNKSPYWKK